MSSVEVVLGLVLIILFYSLLATILMELISGFLSMRGKHLDKVLRLLLSSGDRKEEIFEEFKNSVLYQQLAGRPLGKKTPPSYIESATFRSILTKVIADRSEALSFREKIEQLPNKDLKEVLMQYWDESGQQFQLFAEKVESWYNDVMERANGWYKRNVQKVLLVLGVAIAVVFNVDTLTVYDNLVSSSKVDLEGLTSLAESASRQNIYILPTDSTNAVTTDGSIDRETFRFIQQEVESLKDPLGIGWQNVSPTNDIFFWLFKIFGWLVTAICISKGAPFWFDLLQKIVNFRNTGTLAERAAPAPIHPPVFQPQHHSSTHFGISTDGNEQIDKPVG